MTTSPADSNSPDTNPRSPTIEAIQSEAGLRRVLAYICAQRHRRLIAFTAVFLLIYSLIRILVSFVISVPFGMFTGFIISQDIPISVEMLALLQSLNEPYTFADCHLLDIHAAEIYTKYIPNLPELLR